MKSTYKMNGVDTQKMMETIEAIKETPSLGEAHFRCHSRWMGSGGHLRSRIQDFYRAGEEDTSRPQPFVFDADEPPVLLGENRGANPVEFVLHALAGCITTTMVYHAAARGIALEEIECEIEGDIDLQGFLDINPSVHKGYENIRVNYRIKADASDAQLEELAQLGRTFSPVHDTLTRAVKVDVGVQRMAETTEAVTA